MASKELKAIISIAGTLDPSLGKAINDATKQTGALGTALRAAGGVMAVGTAAIGAASTAVVAFGKSAIDAGMNFDSSMSQVAATMGVTVDEISNLRDFAQEMGSTTAFSATEAADALNYMALAGYDADTSMKMLPNVLNLAAAGSIELATASDMVTDAQTALGLSIDETSVMVDQMAMTASKSNTSVEQLGEAFLTIGANARGVKGGTQELSTVLGVLGDNGIKGAEAGTHLRNIMLALTPTTDKAAAAWKELGVEAYDAEGNLRDLPTVFQELNDSMDGWSDEDRKNQLSEMFNKTDLAAVNSLLGTTAERWDQLSTSIGNADGAAQKMADTQLDNLAGSVTLFKSALEGAQIAVSDQLTPSLKEFVDFGAEGLQTLTQAFNEGGLTGAMDAFGEILSQGLTMVVDMLPQVVDMAVQLLSAFIDGIVNNIDVIVDALIKVAGIAIQGIISALPKLLSGLGKATGSILGSLLGPEFGTAFNSLFDAFMTIGGQIMDVISSGVQTIIPIVIDAIGSIVAIIPTIIDAIQPIYEAIIQIAPLVFDVASQILSALAPIIEFLAGQLATAVQTIAPVIEGALSTIIPLLSEIISALLPPLMSLIGALMPILQAIFDVIQPIISIVMQIIQAVLPLLVEQINTVMSVLTPAIDFVVNVLTVAIENLLPVFESVINPIFDILKNLIDFVVNVFTGNWAAAWENVKNIFRSAFEALAGFVKAPMNAAIAVINAAIDAINSLSIEIPDWVPIYGGQVFGLNIAQLPYLAKGGFTNGVSIAGEAGTEAVISFDPSVRQQNLSYWAKAGKLLGVNANAVDTVASAAKSGAPGGGGNQITFSPNVTIQGNADYDTVMQALRDNEEEFMDMVQEFLARQQAVAYG